MALRPTASDLTITPTNSLLNPNPNHVPQPRNKNRNNTKKVYRFEDDTEAIENDEPIAVQIASNDSVEVPSSSTKTDRQKSILEGHGIMLGKVIGSGNYAKVKIGYSEEYGKRVAVKIISKVKAPAEYTQKFLPREIDTVKGLHHENLIAFYQSIETSHRVYLVMQLAENGTLLDYVRNNKYLEEKHARQLFKQLINAIEYIHGKGVVHRDIKCENILLDENYSIKLIDFGFARKNNLTQDAQVILSKTFCGSYAYASPEILKGIAYDPFLSDIWACGVVCYAMTYGRLPYDGSNVHVLLKRINSALVFPKLPITTMELKQFILHILAPLKNRYTIDQIKRDEWMTMKLEGAIARAHQAQRNEMSDLERLQRFHESAHINERDRR